MKVIKYVHLFWYLTNKEGLRPYEAYRNIQRIRKLPSELKEAVYAVVAYCTPDISYEDISFSNLVEDGMKPIRAILMLDWIRREPMAALDYLSRERLRNSLIIEEKGNETEPIENEDKSDIEI